MEGWKDGRLEDSANGQMVAAPPVWSGCLWSGTITAAITIREADVIGQ